MPGEWLSVVLDEVPYFKDDEEAETCIGYLIEAHNRIVSDSNRVKLCFPFNYEKLSDSEYDMIEGWAYGLSRALYLRPHIWGMSEEYEDVKTEDIPEDILAVIDACITINAIAMPELLEEFLGTVPDAQAEEPEVFEEKLYNILPMWIAGYPYRNQLPAIPAANAAKPIFLPPQKKYHIFGG